jgi:hypothetical protein
MTRPFVGWIFAAFAVAVLAMAWGEVFSPLTHTTFGVTAAVPDATGKGAVVAIVAPHSSAANAGVRVGDVVDLTALSLSDRYRLVTGYSPIGTTLAVPVRRSAVTHIVTLRAGPAGPRLGGAGFALLASATITLLILAFIVLVRPSLATVALVVYGTGAVTTFPAVGELSWLPDPWFGGAAAAIIAVFSYLPFLALLPFLARFPQPPNTPAARLRMHVADALFLIGAIVFTLQAIFELLPFQTWATFDFWSQIVTLIVVLAFGSFAYNGAAGEARRRIGWVMSGFVVSALAFTAFNITIVNINAYTSTTLQTAIDAFILLQCALPIALAYAVLRHRVLDIGFALNRTMVYVTMTTIVIGVVSLADWLAGRLLVEQRWALAVEGFVTVGFGFALNWIHAHTEHLIDRIVFRKRHLAERRISYRISALSFAASPAAVDEAVSLDAAQILELRSAAVFGREGEAGAFVRRAAVGWGDSTAKSLSDDALLVRTLRALERPIFLDDVAVQYATFPGGAERPVLTIPIVAQHELIGFALYGNRADGASPDPEEIALLARLTAAAGSAYGAVEARRWRDRATELERGHPAGNVGNVRLDVSEA